MPLPLLLCKRSSWSGEKLYKISLWNLHNPVIYGTRWWRLVRKEVPPHMRNKRIRPTEDLCDGTVPRQKTNDNAPVCVYRYSGFSKLGYSSALIFSLSMRVAPFGVFWISLCTKRGAYHTTSLVCVLVVSNAMSFNYEFISFKLLRPRKPHRRSRRISICCNE